MTSPDRIKKITAGCGTLLPTRSMPSSTFCRKVFGAGNLDKGDDCAAAHSWSQCLRTRFTALIASSKRPPMANRGDRRQGSPQTIEPRLLGRCAGNLLSLSRAAVSDSSESRSHGKWRRTALAALVKIRETTGAPLHRPPATQSPQLQRHLMGAKVKTSPPRRNASTRSLGLAAYAGLGAASQSRLASLGHQHAAPSMSSSAKAIGLICTLAVSRGS